MAITKVFIVGTPRSGTTWTMMLLGQHPDVVGFQQGALFHALQPLERWWRSSDGFGKRVMGGSNEAPVFVADLLDSSDFERFCAPIVDYALQKVAEAGGARVVVEQTPENLDLARQILRLVPDAYFLHVVRDPRDVFCSMRNANAKWAGKFPNRPSQVARRWVSDMKNARDLQQATSRYHEVRYEDLLADGPARLEEIYAWLGLTADRQLCEAAVKACTFDKLKTKSLGPSGFFRKGQAQSWRTDASRSQIQSIEFVARSAMIEKGYELASRHPDQRPLQLVVEDVLSRSLIPMARQALKPLRSVGKRAGRLLRSA